MTAPTLTAAAAFLLLTMVGPIPVNAAPQTEYTLDITGPTGTTFTGNCVLSTNDGTEDLPMSGSVPLHRQVSGTGISCDLMLESDGTLLVEISSATGNRSRSSTTGRGSRVRISVQ